MYFLYSPKDARRHSHYEQESGALMKQQHEGRCAKAERRNGGRHAKNIIAEISPVLKRVNTEKTLQKSKQ